MDGQAIIQVETISKHYGANIALKQVSFQVNQGEIFGITGTDGSGKSTLLTLMKGQSIPDEGVIMVLDYDVYADIERLREHKNLFMRSAFLIEKLTVVESLEMFQNLYDGFDNVDIILKQFELLPYRDNLVRDLPVELKQRTLLATMVVLNPSIIFLDEPTTGLNAEAKKEYWNILSLLKMQGKTIIIISHDMSEIQYHCDRVGVMKGGRLVVCNSPKRLIGELPKEGYSMEAVYMYYAVGS
ncbi:ABC transporter ATP-binding protein [Paenibacillus sp. GSMTC-2017]|uniref:ABC transporter ATP-binding protein n=1 Tax=Paenibacillus sp. GSMTC-2017 TaxID=2794350 RepID=UPI0018D68BB1|nr:ABC transporter ATP-binding protein [Paenibacillus sp. GSMTC-2017]MBH5320027.1 ABC transporter ATP-binding protein [Paenibacillus sp. GSMTC-2017]